MTGAGCGEIDGGGAEVLSAPWDADSWRDKRAIKGTINWTEGIVCPFQDVPIVTLRQRLFPWEH